MTAVSREVHREESRFWLSWLQDQVYGLASNGIGSFTGFHAPFGIPAVS